MAEKSSLSPDAEPDVRAGRRDAAAYSAAFADAAPRLTRTQALVEAERCLYCFDAPCVQACPTSIDVPSFIRRIGEGNLRGAARTILEANPLGGTCARACPTEELCEEACVRVAQEGQPVRIGRLQRYAVDAVMDRPVTALFARAAPTGRRIAVVGAGPAGLACAFGMARLGHEVVIHDARPRGGGLNEYGLASYKMAGDFAQAEVDWLLGIGGIALELGWRLDGAPRLEALRAAYDAVYLAVGLTRTNMLGVPGEQLGGVRDAIDFIAELRAAPDPALLPIGRRVVVIGGGMTAIDAAVQSRLLGAEDVHLVYRRGREHMSASAAEQRWAQTNGVTIHDGLAPVAIEGDGRGRAVAVRFASSGGGERVFAADTVMKAIGQKLDVAVLADAGLTLAGGRVVADDDGRTGVAGLWAGGDCRAGGRDLTVEAVEDGKRAARSIHAALGARGAQMRPTSSTLA
ncbi:MAG TPA: NAD(P)-dependent oxidoreductase [Caldimonas sp.]|nr:NAD(P)-dependent oxidoreductase [Caldimonas sp.]